MDYYLPVLRGFGSYVSAKLPKEERCATPQLPVSISTAQLRHPQIGRVAETVVEDPRAGCRRWNETASPGSAVATVCVRS